MRQFKSLLMFILSFCLIWSCQKKTDYTVSNSSTASKRNNTPPKGFFIEDRKVPGVGSGTYDINFNTGIKNRTANTNDDPDNGDDQVILGSQLTNPYSVSNMQQAVNTLYGGSYPISASHLYVRFKPADAEQFTTLEDEDLELQKYPMDYEVIQGGDYYQDPNLGTEDFPWLYTVVPIGYNFPAGIQNEVIEYLYLPENNEVLEDMAESMAEGGQYKSSKVTGTNKVIIERLNAQVESYEFEPNPCICNDPINDCYVDPSCESGGGGSGGGSGNDPRIPRGGIQVQDIRTCDFNTTPIVNVPVRQARVVCKRWFKIERTYTNDQGLFVSSKKFKNKVKVIVKTINNNAVVRKVRGIRLWQMLFPIEKQVGVFDQGTMSAIAYLFSKPNPTDAHDKELSYWVAATTQNSIAEYRQYAAEFGIALPPAKLKVIISNWGFMRGAGAAPMLNKCPGILAPDYSTFFLTKPSFLGINNSFTQFALVLRSQVDVMIGYLPPNSDYNCRLTSASLKAITYHELGHASHFGQAGCGFWMQYRQAIENELTKLDQVEFRPYGTGGDQQNAPIIATGEMWGNHCEYIFTNRHYGNGGANGAFTTGGFTARLQGQDFENQPNNLNAYLNAIESFNPHINNNAIDPWPWIPQGLPYDLFDDRNDINFFLPVEDNVTGYTIQQCFNALQPDVRSIPTFRDRLLQQNSNNQQAQVTQLFGQYGY